MNGGWRVSVPSVGSVCGGAAASLHPSTSSTSQHPGPSASRCLKLHLLSVLISWGEISSWWVLARTPFNGPLSALPVWNGAWVQSPLCTLSCGISMTQGAAFPLGEARRAEWGKFANFQQLSSRTASCQVEADWHILEKGK